MNANGKSHLMGKVSAFFSPNKILVGVGAANQVGSEAKAFGAKKVLIITDPGIKEAGLVEGIQSSLTSESIDVCLFDRVELEPPVRVVDQCAELIRKEGYDLIIGLGGGSSLDTAKGAAVIAPNQGKVLDYVGMDVVPKRGLPKILLPTTGGSGAEVTRVFAVTDEADQTKKVVYSHYILADVVILDPVLTLSLPPKVTAETGVDALVHAIESYVSVNATPFSDVLAMEAIRLVSESLPVAYAKGEDIHSRYNMILAACMAGLSWASGGLGAAHGLAYVLEGAYHLGHARAVSIMLPHIMDYNRIGNLSKYGKVAEAMGENVAGLSRHEAATRSITAVKRLIESVGISTRLADYGASEEDIPKLVEGSMKQARLFVPNPRNLTEDDMKGIYLKALNDKKASPEKTYRVDDLS